MQALGFKPIMEAGEEVRAPVMVTGCCFLSVHDSCPDMQRCSSKGMYVQDSVPQVLHTDDRTPGFHMTT